MEILFMVAKVVFSFLAVVVLILGAIILLRRKKKTGVAGATVPGTPPPALSGKKGWFAEYWLTILIALVGAGLAFWAFNAQVQPEDVGSLAWKHWLPFLIIWGVGAALIALNAETLKKAAGVLQAVLAGTMFMFFIVIPLLARVTSPPTAGSQAHTMRNTIPLASSPQETWPSITIGPDGKSDRLPAPPGMRVVVKGNNFLSHYVYADGNECSFGSNCPANIIALYFTNTSKISPTLVMYAYEK